MMFMAPLRSMVPFLTLVPPTSFSFLFFLFGAIIFAACRVSHFQRWNSFPEKKVKMAKIQFSARVGPQLYLTFPFSFLMAFPGF